MPQLKSADLIITDGKTGLELKNATSDAAVEHLLCQFIFHWFLFSPAWEQADVLHVWATPVQSAFPPSRLRNKDELPAFSEPEHPMDRSMDGHMARRWSRLRRSKAGTGSG